MLPVDVSKSIRLHDRSRDLCYDEIMTYEKLLHELGSRDPSDTTLRAAVCCAERLEQVAKRGLERARNGHQRDRGRNLTLYALYACAAAGQRNVWDDWVAFLHAPRATFERLFGLLDEYAAARLTLCLIDAGRPQQIETLFGLLKRKELFWAVRYGVWLALARLVHDGHVSRTRMIEFIQAYPTNHVTPEFDLSLFGWMFAIILLGLTDLSAELETQWMTAPTFSRLREVDRGNYRGQLRMSAQVGNSWFFDQYRISAFCDPVEGLSRPRSLLQVA